MKKQFYLLEGEEQQIILQSETRPVFQQPNFQASMISTGYDSLKKLMEGEQILKKPCAFCGNWVRTHFITETKKRLTERNLCFSCDLWDRRVDEWKQSNKFIVNGVCYSAHSYVLDANREQRDRLGFGGSRFIFQKLDDNSVTVSNNVWCGGEVPNIWCNLFPDNARFLKEDIEGLFAVIKDFSDKKFGKRTDVGPLNHLKREIKEILEIDPTTDKHDRKAVEEYADCLILLLDAFRLRNPTYWLSTLIRRAFEKVEINRVREYAAPDEEGVMEHIDR